MAPALPLRAALTRGALIAAANWPLVAVEFTIESLYKLALAVPVVGGAFMVAVLLGADLRVWLDAGLRSTAEFVIASLESAPVALAAFCVAAGLVALGGALVMFVVKAGTLAVVVEADAAAGEVQRPPVSLAAVRRARRFRPDAFVAGARRFGRRVIWLTLSLGGAYVAIAVAYVAALAAARTLLNSPWAAGWALLVLLATCGGIVLVAAVNLAFDLLRIIVVTDDCGVGTAVARLRRFVLRDARQVLGIFGSVGVVLMLATAASLLTTASLTFVAWVPIAGVISVPLRAAAWLVQGLVFQFLSLTAMSAYQTQYRRFAGRAAGSLSQFAEHA